MLVRWLGSFPASALLAQVGGSVNTRSSPTSERLAQVGGSVNTRSSPVTENAPLGNVREPTGGVLSKVDQVGLSRWSCCHWILGKAFTLTPSIRSESELLDLHVHRRYAPTFQETAEG